MKDIDNKLISVKLKNYKEPFLKGKLAKGFKPKEIQLSNDNNSNDTFANTEEDNQEFEYLNSESKQNLDSETNIKQFTSENENTNQTISKPKMKSRLSLKSRAYVRSFVPNMVNNKITPVVSFSYLIIMDLDKY